MHAWESIQKVLDYIEDNLAESHSPEELAKIAALSPFYFQRLFTRLVKRPVSEYIKMRRLARACDILKDKDSRILDIALDCGFNSHEHFTKSFKSAFGMTPEEYRSNPIWLNQVDKPDLLLGHVIVDEGVPLISDGLILEFNRKLLEKPIVFMGLEGIVPIAGQMPLGEATGVDIPGQLWERFHREKHAIPRLDGGREIGVAYLGDAPKGSFTYFAGAEVAANAENPNFSKWELPAREYIVCGFEAENFEQLVTAALNKAVKYSGQWLSQHGMTMDAYSPEVYYDSSPEGSYMEIWLPFS